MEYTLWERGVIVLLKDILSLNPYSNGIYSLRSSLIRVMVFAMCLNPYSNGIYSLSVVGVAPNVPNAMS